jgi:ketosteroid isomerase-like protein
VDTLDAARRWAREWERAWREHDVEAVASLYAEGADFRPHPFRDATAPGAYAAWAFADETRSGNVRFSEPILLDGDRALVEYWAVVEQDGRASTIAGTSILRFDEQGLVVEERDYFNEDAAPRDPHPAWGR